MTAMLRFTVEVTVRRQSMVLATVLSIMALSGCALAPRVPPERETALKAFPQPPQGMTGVYVYRNSHFLEGPRLKVYLDGALVGRTKNCTFLYTVTVPGPHELITESEFGDNAITIQAAGGENLFVEQVMKLGMFSVRAGLERVSVPEGMQEVRKCVLAESN